MGLFDSVGSVLNSVGTLANSLGSASSIQGALGTVGRMAGALNNLSNPAGLVSALRSVNIPSGAMSGFKSGNSTASFGAGEGGEDWRVRLSVPGPFKGSPVLTPLNATNGLVFPYTPTIQMSGNASYENTPVTHNNYSYFSYQNSTASSISITGPFNVEDVIQAQYWIAAVHYLRSVTKMFTGDSAYSGNPPPMVYLNGYGEYVFKNIPVIITNFTVELPQDVAYISTTVGTEQPVAGYGMSTGGSGQTIENAANTFGVLGGIAGFVGAGKAANALGAAGAALSVVNNASNLLKGSTGGGSAPFSNSGKTHVPVKSVISVTCQPVWSRKKVRTFNLDSFVNGDYVDSKPGYL